MKPARLLPATVLTVTMLTASGTLADQHAATDIGLASQLSGAVFSGAYLRAGTPYTMTFGRDGQLTDSAGREGRWWVNDAEEYCREWTSGPMAGVTTCMEVILHVDRIAIYAGDEKVLEGELLR